MGNNVQPLAPTPLSPRTTHPPGEIASVGLLTAVNLVLQTLGGVLGNLQKISQSLGLVLGSVLITIGIGVVLWRRQSITAISAILLSYGSIVTALLIILLNLFVNAVPVSVKGSIVDRTNGHPLAACVEIQDEAGHHIGTGQLTAEDGSFLVLNVPSGSYRLVVNGMWARDVNVPGGYTMMFETGFSGQVKLAQEPVETGTTAETDVSVSFYGPDNQPSGLLTSRCGS